MRNPSLTSSSTISSIPPWWIRSSRNSRVAVTLNRILTHTEISIVTTLRADEILAGGTLALAFDTPIFRDPALSGVGKSFRAFAARASRGERPSGKHGLHSALSGRSARWQYALRNFNLVPSTTASMACTGIHSRHSYALYILHRIVSWEWLGSGPPVIRYAKHLPELMLVVVGTCVHFLS